MGDFISTISIMTIVIMLGIFSLALFLRSPIVPIGFLLIIFLMNSFLRNGLPFIRIGRFNINPLDILSVLMIISAIMRMILVKTRHLPLLKFLVLALGIMLMVSWGRGTTLFGLESATNYFRTTLFFFSSVFFLTTFQYKENIVHRMIYWWGIVAWLLIGLAFWRWGQVILGISKNPDWMTSSGMMVRVLNASQTFVILQSVIFAWVFRGQENSLPLQRLMPYIAIPAIILLQHRTIWVVFLFLLICIFFMMKRTRPIILFMTLVAMLLGGFTVLALWEKPLLNSLTNSVINLDNFKWRVAGWMELISPAQYSHVIDYFIGQPLGTGYERYLFGSSTAIGYSPHNFYVQTFLNIGVIGLILFLLIYLGTLKSLLEKRHDKHKTAFALILISQLLFFMTYAPNFEQGILLGFSILLAGLNDKQELIQ